MNRIIKQNRHYNNNDIFHYKNSYHQVPIWVLMDFLSFGDTVALYSVLPKKLRDKIAADCLSFVMDNQPTFAGNFSEDKMSAFLQNINEVRNICAHNKRLIAFKCRQDCINFKPLFKYYDRNLQIDRQSPYSVFLTIQCFVSKIEFAQLHNGIRKKAHYLDHRLQTISIDKILDLLGFPAGWQKSPKLLQDKPK